MLFRYSARYRFSRQNSINSSRVVPNRKTLRARAPLMLLARQHIPHTSVISHYLDSSGPGETIKVEFPAALLTNPRYDPVSPTCRRGCTIDSADVRVSSGHASESGSVKKKRKLLRARDAVAVNNEWLKILKNASDKMKEVSNTVATSKGDMQKAGLSGMINESLFFGT